MRIGYDVAHDLLLVRVAFDAADDGNVDLDEIRIERDEVALIAVAAAVIVERIQTGQHRGAPLHVQYFEVEILLLGDLDDDIASDAAHAAAHFLDVCADQADARDRIDEQPCVFREQAALLPQAEKLGRGEHGELFDVIQPSGLLRELHDRAGRAEIGRFGAHERLIGRRLAVPVEDRLKMIGHAALREHLLEFLRDLGLIGGLVVYADVEFLHAALVRALDLIHREIGVFLERGHIVPVLGVPRHAARDADGERIAVRQDDGRAAQTALQAVEVAPKLLTAVVAVEQHHELIARQTAAYRVPGHRVVQRAAGLADIAVAGVVAVDVVQRLEVIEVEHHERRMAQTGRCAEQALAGAVERLAVVKAGQHIVVALVFDAQPLLSHGRHVLEQTDLRLIFKGDAQPDVAHAAVLLRDAEHAAAVRQAEILVFRDDPFDQLFKIVRRQLALRLSAAEHGKKVVRRIDRRTLPQLVAGQLDARHVDDALKAGRGVDDAAAEVGEGGRKAVQLRDAGARQARKVSRGELRGRGDLVRQARDRPGQSAAGKQAAEQTDEHGQQYGDDQPLLHAARKREQPGRRDRSDQHPVAPL